MQVVKATQHVARDCECIKCAGELASLSNCANEMASATICKHAKQGRVELQLEIFFFSPNLQSGLTPRQEQGEPGCGKSSGNLVQQVKVITAPTCWRLTVCSTGLYSTFWSPGQPAASTF